MRSLLIFSFGLMFLPYCFVQAQISNDIVGNAVKINLEPSYPNPGQIVTATLDDYAINNTNATIAWFMDNKLIAGTGNSRTITFSAPGVGKKVEIAVTLTSNTGQSLVAKQVLSPVYLDLIVEPQTYTPIFYQGRALPVNGSLININALVTTGDGLVDSSQYSYNWQLNGKSLYGGARKGNSWAQISTEFGGSVLVSVAVSDSRGVVVSKKIARIPMDSVKIKFYEVNTLYGLSHKSIMSPLTLIGNSTSIRAVPYNLDTRVTDGSLFTEWAIDSRSVVTQNSDPFEINLSRSSGGQSTIGFKVRNLLSLLQGDEAVFAVQF